jgi:hypothetical protein
VQISVNQLCAVAVYVSKLPLHPETIMALRQGLNERLLIRKKEKNEIIIGDPYTITDLLKYIAASGVAIF